MLQYEKERANSFSGKYDLKIIYMIKEFCNVLIIKGKDLRIIYSAFVEPNIVEKDPSLSFFCDYKPVRIF